MSRIITGPPGLGDLIFIIQKLINANEKFIWRLPNGYPQRGHQVLELLPSIVESWYYDRIRFSNVRGWNVSKQLAGADIPRWKDIHNNDIFLEANTLLESGQRIENFLPDLPISFRLTYETTEEHKRRADEILGKRDKKTVGIYMSSIGTNAASGTWNPDEWKDFLASMLVEFDCHFCFFAAQWDQDMLKAVTEPLENNYPLFYDESLGAVIEGFKQLDYLIGFQSGMSIINETLGKDGMMLYRKADRNIIGTWADSRRITSGQIKECQFAPPEQIVNWIKENNKL